MPRRRAAATMERDAQALELYRDGESYQHIADTLGWKSKKSAFDAVRRAIGDLNQLAKPERRDLQRERLDYLVGVFEEVLGHTHYAVASNGTVALHPSTGEPLTDDAPKIQAGLALLRLNESYRKLDGLDAAKQVEVRTIDAIDAKLLELADEVGGLGQGDPARVPRET